MTPKEGSLVRPVVSVDVVCFALHEGRLELLLVKRSEAPFAGWWALPGGVVGSDEALDAAARRVLAERTGVRQAFLEQLFTFGDPKRDPRGRTISVSYYAILPERPSVRLEGRGSTEAGWIAARELPRLAFDHTRIALYALKRLAQKLDYTPLAFRLVPERFTLGDVRAVHQAITSQEYDLSNFNRQVLSRWQLTPVPGALDRRTRRPARLYRYASPHEIDGPPEGSA